jgi:protein-disulfide isomerase
MIGPTPNVLTTSPQGLNPAASDPEQHTQAWSPRQLVDEAEELGRSLGVRGTPAWFVSGRLISGLYPREQFEQLAQVLAVGM